MFKTLKKLTIVSVLALALLAMTGCGGNSARETPTPSPTEAAPAAQTASDGTSVVVYFSATGTTRGVAQKIAAATGSDVYEIVPAEPYTSADLDYNDSSSRTTIEMADSSARPALAGDPIDLSAYSTVYLGYPIWWGDAPRIMSTFVESVDLDGKTVIPFCTSGGSGIGGSAKTLEQQAGAGTWKAGARLDGAASDAAIASFIQDNR
ncbi:MAG: flavodoxin [Actinomycetota bacterium]|nr:flavodoxin [Actinomycetota bacterium]